MRSITSRDKSVQITLSTNTVPDTDFDKATDSDIEDTILKYIDGLQKELPGLTYNATTDSETNINGYITRRASLKQVDEGVQKTGEIIFVFAGNTVSTCMGFSNENATGSASATLKNALGTFWVYGKKVIVTFANDTESSSNITTWDMGLGACVPTPKDLERDGQIITNWTTSDSNQAANQFLSIQPYGVNRYLISGITKNITLSPVWSKAWTVTFTDGQGNVLGSPRTVANEQSATAPLDPTRAGYDFTGWDADYSHITSDLTVNATWRKQPTRSQLNALETAKSYLESVGGFSHSSLVEQLEYEKYSHEDALYAADNCGADWKAQAAEAAQHYLQTMPFSRDGLIEQLEYEGFTPEEATYGVDATGL